MPSIAANQRIRWLPDYAVGVQEIDQEHQGLFALADRLRLALDTGKALEILVSNVDELVDYTGFHFTHEEELMQRISYPHYRDHCRQHEDLRSKVAALKQRLALGEPGTVTELMQFLVDWLRCHTTTSDRRIGTYMRKCGLIV